MSDLRARIIAIEGIDGSGKHTQTERLRQRLEAAGLRVRTLSFPRYGQTLMARTVADYLNGAFGPLDGLPPHFPALLYAGDRFQSRPLIEAALAEADVLLLDRYVASNLAHQGARVPAEQRDAFIGWLSEVEHGMYDLPRPDLTVLLDVPVDVSMQLVLNKKPRDYTDAAADLHERDRAYLEGCYDVYHRLADAHQGSRWAVVPCTDGGGMRTIEAIHADVWDAAAPVARGAAAAG